MFYANLPGFRRDGLSALSRTAEGATAAVRAAFEESTGGDFGPAGSRAAWTEACDYFGFHCSPVALDVAYHDDRPGRR